MNEIKRLFKELRYEVFKISFIHAVADSVIFFMLALNITTLLDLKYYFALAVAVIFLFGDVSYRTKQTTFKEIEDRNPNIRDILRTAQDCSEGTDFMVLAMFEDLIQKMKSVSAGSLLNPNRLFVKTILLCVLSFSVILLASNNIHVPKSVFDPATYYKWFSNPGKDRLDFYTIEFNESELLYGDPDLADLGNRTLEIHINPSINEMSFDSVKEPEEKEFERGTFPGDIAAVSDASSEEKLPKESKIAIAYNLKLKEVS